MKYHPKGPTGPRTNRAHASGSFPGAAGANRRPAKRLQWRHHLRAALVMTVEEWAEKHRSMGHNPFPSPTEENPERWLCECSPDGGATSVWRILTPGQIRRKYAHLGAEAVRRRHSE